MKPYKIVEVGPYPPPASGWSVRIKYLKEEFDNLGHDCQILNLGKNRTIKSDEYIDIQSGIDYVQKLIGLRFKGYHIHMHMNAQAVKGPILSFTALLIAFLTFDRASVTFHGGIEQLYFPRRNGGKMYPILFLNFLFARLIICNNEQIKDEIVRYGPFISNDKIKPIPAFSVQYMQYTQVDLGQRIEHLFDDKKNILSCYIVLRNGFYIETLLGYLENIPTDTGLVLVGIRNVEDEDISWQYKKLLEFEKAGTIVMVENLDRNQFLTLLQRSDICLRTPVSDGVASSVLESLYLGTPVVASENGRRPDGVITYQPENSDDLFEKVTVTLGKIDQGSLSVVKPDIQDTVVTEIKVLINTEER